MYHVALSICILTQCENRNGNHFHGCIYFLGYYCASSGLSTPTGPCDGGYYCPEGQNVSSPAAYICTPGHYCPIGSPALTSCPSGTYQDEYGKVS